MKLIHVGKFLKQGYFDESDYTLAELAKEIGVSNASLSRLFCGKASLSYEMAVKLESVWGRKATTWLDHQTRWELQQLGGKF